MLAFNGGKHMTRSRQETKSLFVDRPLTVVGSFFVMAACGLSIAAGPALASPNDRAWTADDVAKEKVYSPYAGRRAWSEPRWTYTTDTEWRAVRR
jgi:hypothetical protein